MKILNIILLLILRILNLQSYIKIRSLFQLKYINLKEGRFSTFLLNIIRRRECSESKLRIIAADRIKVRKFIKENCNNVLLAPIYWSGNFLSKSDYKKLPQFFYIKHISSSGITRLINKRIHKLNEVNRWIWLYSLIDYGWLTRQWFYTSTKEFIAEGLISDEPLVDYKFFCKNGSPFLLQVDIDRKIKHKRNLYSIDNEGESLTLLDVRLHHFENDLSFSLPNIVDAYKIASRLSRDFSFVRVDLYIVYSKVFFGELTNLPGSGFEKFYPTLYDERIFKLMNQKTS